MDVYDLLTKKKRKVPESEFIVTKKKSSDYVVSVPHSGTLVPQSFLPKLFQGTALLQGADIHTDVVFAVTKGKHILSQLSRFVVDMNHMREGDKQAVAYKSLDPLHGNSVTGEPILVKEHTLQEKKQFMGYYDRYHKQLQELIGTGPVFVVEGHAMDPIGPRGMPDEGKERADCCVGTLDGTSAHPACITAFVQTLREGGLHISLDDPYKGGAITRQYGKPEKGVHVIQVEVNKSMYMDEHYNIKKSVRTVTKVIQEACQAATEAVAQ